MNDLKNTMKILPFTKEIAIDLGTANTIIIDDHRLPHR